MKVLSKSWLCTVKPQYVALMKEGKKTIEVRTRVPKLMKKGDLLCIMEKGTNTLALVTRVESITTFERKDLYLKVPRYQLRRTCLTFAEIEEYLNGRNTINFIEISVMWTPREEERKYLTPESYGYKRMPQGILPNRGWRKP